MVASLTPLSEISIPSPAAYKSYAITISDVEFHFTDLKKLLGAADIHKSGDKLADLAAHDDLEREAARNILSNLSLQELYEQPLTTLTGDIDDVMRVNYDIDLTIFSQYQKMTVGEAKDFLLSAAEEEIKSFGRNITGVIAAAIAKLCDVHELIYIAKKITHPTTARTRIGDRGVLSSRLQPNHPTDDLRGISYLVYTGLSMGAGDCLIGINPVKDDVAHVTKLIRHLVDMRSRLEVPTQICVLAHLKTQMACLKQGEPVEIMFQSLAGTSRALTDEFDVDIQTLDDAYKLMQKRGPIKEAEQFMYFETGQGSECSYQMHNDIDMTTAEALCYGLARRYDPFMVNNVTGFIGPETHANNDEMIISCLQDHFMAKLMGLPMGMAPCFTLHSDVNLFGQQIATQLLTAAGANYYMDVHLGVDRMLAYFDTSGHDDQTLREIYHKQPTKAYQAWGIKHGIFAYADEDKKTVVRGKNWGNPEALCDAETLHHLKTFTPVTNAMTHAGPRPKNHITRETQLNIATSKHAVYSELQPNLFDEHFPYRLIGTQAKSKQAHLSDINLGASLAEEDASTLTQEPHQIQIVAADGLSAEATHYNVSDIIPTLLEAFAQLDISVGTPIIAPYARVKLAENIIDKTGCELVIMLIGERPGGDAAASRSLSAYLVYAASNAVIEYSLISNIHDNGTPALEGASIIIQTCRDILRHQAAGNRLNSLLHKEAQALNEE